VRLEDVEIAVGGENKQSLIEEIFSRTRVAAETRYSSISVSRP